MPATKKRRDTMLASANSHLDWAERSLGDGMPSDATMVLVSARIGLATAWILLAQETVD